jgi:hypothetical protein
MDEVHLPTATGDARQELATRLRDLAEVPGELRASADEERLLRELLWTASSSAELMPRLLDGDPLHLYRRGSQRLRDQSRLLDPRRLLRHAAARVAVRAFGWTGKLPIEEWIGRCIDEAIWDCIRQDEQEEYAGLLVSERNARHYDIVQELLGVPQMMARRAMLTWNRLPGEQRQLLFHVVVQGWSFDRCTAAGLGEPEVLQSRLTEALRAVSEVSPDVLPAPAEGEGLDSFPNES